MTDVAPNDPAVVQSLASQLTGLIEEFKSYAADWQGKVDAVVVQLQNVGSAVVTPEGGVTTSVPESLSTEPTGLSTGATAETTSTPESVPPVAPASTLPEDQSHTTTITDPSGDDKWTQS